VKISISSQTSLASPMFIALPRALPRKTPPVERDEPYAGTPPFGGLAIAISVF
jgi:hypothetical protein